MPCETFHDRNSQRPDFDAGMHQDTLNLRAGHQAGENSRNNKELAFVCHNDRAFAALPGAEQMLKEPLNKASAKMMAQLIKRNLKLLETDPSCIAARDFEEVRKILQAENSYGSKMDPEEIASAVNFYLKNGNSDGYLKVLGGKISVLNVDGSTAGKITVPEPSGTVDTNKAIATELNQLSNPALADFRRYKLELIRELFERRMSELHSNADDPIGRAKNEAKAVAKINAELARNATDLRLVVDRSGKSFNLLNVRTKEAVNNILNRTQ